MSAPALAKPPSRWPRWAGYLGPPAVRPPRAPEPERSGSRLVLELFAILGLSACYYFLVRDFALGVGSNLMNSGVFTACGSSMYHLDMLNVVWQGRLAGLVLSGS